MEICLLAAFCQDVECVDWLYPDGTLHKKLFPINSGNYLIQDMALDPTGNLHILGNFYNSTSNNQLTVVSKVSKDSLSSGTFDSNSSFQESALKNTSSTVVFNNILNPQSIAFDKAGNEYLAYPPRNSTLETIDEGGGVRYDILKNGIINLIKIDPNGNVAGSFTPKCHWL